MPPLESKIHVADARTKNWVESHAPAVWVPFLQLSRIDRPIGTWLLLLPCLWSVTLAAAFQGHAFPSLWLFLAFTIGAFAMRGAGCTLNDLFDQDLDAQVARTANRPLPSGRVTNGQALAWLGLQCFAGLLVLLTFNSTAFWWGMASLLLVVPYPVMKRITYWPQAWLGLTFNWGALLGWIAVTGELSWAAIWLYIGGVFWTLGYDTVYAHQDRDDDALIGVKSTALALGGRTKHWLRIFYSVAAGAFLIALVLSGAGFFAYLGLLALSVHFLWQVRWVDVDQPHLCLMVFKSNRDAGLLFLTGLVLGLWL